MSPPLRERILVPGGRHGCTSGCWHPDGTLPVDLRDHRLAPGALCGYGPGTADRHHADRLWFDQPGDSGGSMPAALDQLLLDGAQGAVRLEGDGPCLVPHREAGVPIRALRGDDTLIPRWSEAAPGAAIQYDHARKPNRPNYILAQTVVSLSAVIGNSSGSWSVPLMSNLAVHTGNHGKLETMRAMVEEVSATLGAITLLLDAWYMKGYLISDVLTRDIIVIGQVRRDTALYDLPPLRTGKPGRPRKYGDRITKEKLNALPQTRTELPIYGRTVRSLTAVCRARF